MFPPSRPVRKAHGAPAHRVPFSSQAPAGSIGPIGRAVLFAALLSASKMTSAHAE
jgi:hypothetical protein